jgi:hypothetical protein
MDQMVANFSFGIQWRGSRTLLVSTAIHGSSRHLLVSHASGPSGPSSGVKDVISAALISFHFSKWFYSLMISAHRIYLAAQAFQCVSHCLMKNGLLSPFWHWLRPRTTNIVWKSSFLSCLDSSNLLGSYRTIDYLYFYLDSGWLRQPRAADGAYSFTVTAIITHLVRCSNRCSSLSQKTLVCSWPYRLPPLLPHRPIQPW